MMHKLKKVYLSLSFSLHFLRQKANLLQCKSFPPGRRKKKQTKSRREEKVAVSNGSSVGAGCKLTEGYIAITVLHSFSPSDECYC
jgi:hypothetical protein